MSEVYLNIPENGNLDIQIPYVKIIEQDNISRMLKDLQEKEKP